MKQENFAAIKDKIIYVLESAAAVENSDNARPHEVYLDMVKTFRIYQYDEEYDYNIAWHDLEKWGVGLEAVAEAANRNTPVLNPPVIYRIAHKPAGVQQLKIGDSMDAILEKMAHIEDITYPMFMLTNAAQSYGAGSILNEPLLERIAGLWEDDIILLPSSVHEFLMIPFAKRRMELKEWQESVMFMNSRDFMERNVLSDSVYLYDRDKKKVVIGYCSR